MSTFEEERKFERETGAIVEYFQLLYIEQLTYDKCMDTFKMLGGDTLLRRVFENEKEGYISLEETNYELIQKLEKNLDEILNKPRSISAIYEKTFHNLGWLEELSDSLEISDETARNTILAFSKYGTYNDACSKEYCHTNRFWAMKKHAIKTKELTQKKENS